MISIKSVSGYLLPDRRKVCTVYDCIILTVYQCVYFLSCTIEGQKSYIETAKQGRDENSDENQYAKERNDDEITGQAFKAIRFKAPSYNNRERNGKRNGRK